METNKRKYRQLSDSTKQRISQSLKGRGKSSQHSQKISDGLKSYWKQIPDSPEVEAQKNKSVEPEKDGIM